MENFEDAWELAACLRAADRRLGRACLLDRMQTRDSGHPALVVIRARFGKTASWPRLEPHPGAAFSRR
jgi:hypothetical protein